MTVGSRAMVWGGFRRAGGRMVRHMLAGLRRQSRFKTAVVGGFGLSFVLGLYGLFLAGFQFLDNLGGVGLMIIHRLFALFFLGLGGLLMLSSAVAVFPTMVRSGEVTFLWRLPVDRRDIVLMKSVQSGLLSSWAFVFVILPFIAAYARTLELSPLFPAWTLLFAVPFLLVCNNAGVLLCLTLVRVWPTGRAGRWLSYGLLALLLCGAAVLLFHRPERGPDLTGNLAQLIPGIGLAAHPLWPSWWVAEGISAMAFGQVGRGALFLALLLSTGGMGLLLLEAVGPWLLTGIRERDRSTSRRRRRQRNTATRRAWLRPLPGDVRAILVKDALVFLRDPRQWSQGALFFGILGLYFANLRNFNYHLLPDLWKNLIVFLNMFALFAVMCSCGARFLYPQFSLEGQAFWVLGRSPSSVGRLLGIKFLGAFLGFGSVGLVLMGLSAAMLRLSPQLTGIALLLSLCMSCAVAGLSVGLGATFLDLRQRNPTVIISGFGGTLNLVLSLLFMLGSIMPFGAVFHLRVVGVIPPSAFAGWLFAAVVGLILGTGVTAGLPLAVARRRLRGRDF